VLDADRAHDLTAARAHVRRRAQLVVAAALLILCSACQVDIAVGVDARPDGSGTVQVTATLDKDAAAQAGPLALDDLRKAGWKVTGPAATASGGQTVQVTKDFRDASGLNAVVSEVSGATGPFRDFRLSRQRSFFTTRTRFTGVVDFGPGVGGFSDDDLKKRLGGAGDIGLDPAAVERVTRARLDQLFRFVVTARLPGSVTTSNAPTTAGNGAVWRPKLGERITLATSSRSWNTLPIAFAIVAVVGALGLLVIAVRWLFRRRSAVSVAPPP
jgi:hypothetical protein